MGQILMIESWVGAMSELLPRAIHESGHNFTLVTRDLQHYVRRPTEGPHPLLSARHILRAETNDIDELVAWLDQVRGAIEFDAVITSCDYYLPAVARIGDRFGLPGPRPGAVETSLNKDRARAAFEAAGLPGPVVRSGEDWKTLRLAALEIGYPLVVKPVDLCGGMFVRRADHEADLRTAVDALTASQANSRQQRRRPTVLLEEFLTGPEVSVESVTVGDVTHVIGVTDKSIARGVGFVETGHMFPADLPAQQVSELADLARAAIAAVGLTDCVSHLEVKLTPSGPRIVELNPRPGGNRISELVRRVTGIDLVRTHVQLAVGERPDVSLSKTGLRSAAVQMLLPPHAGRITEVVDTMDHQSSDVVELVLPDVGSHAASPNDNNCYVGRVMTVDSTGSGARQRAEKLVEDLQIVVQHDPAVMIA